MRRQMSVLVACGTILLIDVLHYWTPEKQQLILSKARQALRPGGRLIYAVCSLQSEEGTARLAGSGLAAEPFQPDELPGLSEAISTDGFLRTYPYMWSHIGGMDGFFAARLTRH